jgi:pyrroloquinoline quinone biosynthesis protein B
MRIKLLGTAAGGGFPQWNCDCANCRSARAGEARATARLQSCIAIGNDEGDRWFLVGASPDIRVQVEALPRRKTASARGSGVDAIFLPSADLDQTLGLFILREGVPLRVFATPTVRQAVCEGLNLDKVLGTYCGIRWSLVPTEQATLLNWSDGTPSGISCVGFRAPGKPPRYRERVAFADPWDTVGFQFGDERTGGRVIIAPGLASLDEALMERLAECDALLVDGTFWDEHELSRVTGSKTSTPATAMGHLPVGGISGSLVRLSKLFMYRRIYLHVNNTNPMILDDSPERRHVEDAGFEVGRDGLEFVL